MQLTTCSHSLTHSPTHLTHPPHPLTSPTHSLKPKRTFARRWLRLGRVPPSTPVAAAKVVILSDAHSKQEMDALITAALAESGISPRRTRVGWDIICRSGDPTNVSKLIITLSAIMTKDHSTHKNNNNANDLI